MLNTNRDFFFFLSSMKMAVIRFHFNVHKNEFKYYTEIVDFREKIINGSNASIKTCLPTVKIWFSPSLRNYCCDRSENV